MAADKVVVDIELKGFGSAKKNLDDFTKAQIEQQDAIKATKDVIKEYEKELQAIAKEQALGNEITDESILRERELKESLEESRVSLAGQKDKLSAVNTERRAAVKEVDTYNTALNAEIGSNEQLRAQLKILTQEYDGLSQEQRENTEEGQKLTQNIEGITDKLKENESAIGDNRRNVGNYSESIQDALGNVTIMGTNLGGLVTSFKETTAATAAAAKSLVVTESVQKSQAAATTAQTAAQKGLNVATIAGKVAMNVFKLALIATGIGAFVVIVGSLVAYFKSTEKGAQQLKVVMAVLGSITANITSKMAEFGETIVNAFSSIKDLNIGDIFKSIGDAIKDNLMNRIEAFGVAGKAIAKIFSGDMVEGFKDLGNAVLQGVTGVEDVIGKVENGVEALADTYVEAKEAVKEFVEEVKEDMKSAADLQKAENNLVFERRKLLLANVELEKTVAKARADAADKANLSQDEIIAKLEEAKEAETQKLKNLTKIAKAEFDIQKGRSALATDNEEEAETLFQKELAYKQAIAAEEQGTLRLKKQIASESYILMTESLAAELRLIKAQGGDQISALIEIEEKKRAAQLADTTLSETQRQAIIAESNNKIAELNEKALDEELENKITDLEYLKNIKLEDDKLTNDQRLDIEKKFQKDKAIIIIEELGNQAELVKAELDQITADGSITPIEPLTPEEETALKEQLNLINKEITKAKETISGIEGEEAAGISLLNGLGLDEVGMEKLSFAFQTIDASLSAISGLMASVTERNKKLIQEQVEQGVISQEEADKKIEKIEKRAFKRNKAMQIAMAISSTAQAVASALAQTVDPTLTQSFRTANAIAAGVLGGVQVATIAATKFQDGGMINGNSHANGGVPFTVAGRGGFEAEGGEFITNKRAVSHYGTSFMDAVNNMQIPKIFADGGLVAPAPVGGVGSQVSQSIAEGLAASQGQRVEVINVESDFSNIQNRVNNVEQSRTY